MLNFIRSLLGLTKKTLYVNEIAGFRVDSQRYEKGIIQDGKRYDTAVFELDGFPCAHAVFRSSSRRSCKRLHKEICRALESGDPGNLNSLIVYGNNLFNIPDKEKNNDSVPTRNPRRKRRRRNHEDSPD